MVRSISLLFLVFTLTSFSLNMELKKDKVKFKKGIVYINSVEYAKYERTGNKFFLKTLSDEDFVSINFLSFGSGRYHKNGQEIMTYYQELNFYIDSIGTFEVSSSKKGIIRDFNEMNVLVNGKVSIENIKKFKTKYSEKISERRFLTK